MKVRFFPGLLEVTMSLRLMFCAAVLLICAGIGFLALSQQHHRTMAFEAGQKAAEAGLPPECNPYRDYVGSAWLDGYASKKK